MILFVPPTHLLVCLFFYETKALYEACAPSRGASEIHDSWLRLLDKRKSRQRKRYSLLTRISTYAAVAMFAAAITSTVFIFSSREYDDRITSYVGGDGLEADVVVLPDGTRVSLGTRTSFSYDSRYGKSERIVQLEGEAYFEVAKDKDKPFIVKTKEQSIEALGTKFNVSAYPTDSLLTTTLLEGSVLLTTQNLLHPMVLKPNEQFVYNKRTRSALLQQVDANRFVSWTTGYYYFPEQSLEAILYRLSHVYGVQFTVKSEALKRRTFTGTFYRGQSIKDIMEIIHLSIPVRYKIDDHHVTISEI